MLQFLAIPPAYRWLITLAFVAILIVLSVTPGKSQAGDSMFIWLIANTPTLLQKLMHVFCYALLTGLWVWTLEAIESRVLRLALSLLLAVSLGGILEWYQTKVPGRFGSIVDVLLNAGGAVAGLLLAFVFL